MERVNLSLAFALCLLFVTAPSLLVAGEAEETQEREWYDPPPAGTLKLEALLQLARQHASADMEWEGSPSEPQIKAIHGHSSDVSDEDLSCLLAFPELRLLWLGNTRITGAELHVLRHLHDLTDLQLADTGVDNAALAHVGVCTRLEVLNLGGCRAVGDPGMESVAKLNRLRDLDLSGTGLTDAGLAKLGRKKKLERLSLGNTRISDAGLDHVVKFTRLVNLDLSWTQITNDGLKKLRFLPDLRYLILNNTVVTDAGIPSLRDIPSLEAVYLHGANVSAEAIRTLMSTSGIRIVSSDVVQVSRLADRGYHELDSSGLRFVPDDENGDDENGTGTILAE